MAVAQPTRPGVPDLREPAGWRRTKNNVMTTLMWIAFVVTLVPLVLAIYTVVAKGAGAISWQFLTSHTTPRIGPPLPNIPGLNLNTGGAGPAIVGTLVEVGRGTRGESWPAEVLAAQDRRAAGMTAPPQGLFLLRVEYNR